MEAKPFAMGFRIEHPQELIDTIQYGAATSALVDRGKGTVPVADYRLTANNVGGAPGTTSGGPRGTSAGGGGVPSTSTLSEREKWMEEHVTMEGDSWEGIKQRRNVYSFCMCPGGLVLPTSVEEDELCVNGMSFSRRNSPWANSAVVVGVLPADWREFKDEHGPLAGVRLQEETERRAARMGGGGMKAPVQRVTDFLDGRLSGESTCRGQRASPAADYQVS